MQTPTKPESVIVYPSGAVSATWLFQTLSLPLFGGDVDLQYNPVARDMRPVRVSWKGEWGNGGLS